METIITASPVSRLRDPEHERLLAIIHKPTAPTANLVSQRVMSRILDWHATGNIIETHDHRVLNIKRMEFVGEQFVYDIGGKPIFLEKGVPLIRMDDCWGENSRRTINRHFEKIDRPSTQQVDKRRLPMMFWMDISMKAMEQTGL